ncbi:MAG: VIT domain-containing protein [Myxococcales bacterium]|nr:VIT domain-containing protein [Myxococcales bacterium]
MRRNPAISRLALQIGETYQEGEVVERQKARVAYEEALHRRRDPALLERDAGNEHRVRVFPIEANATKRLIVSYSQVLDDARESYRLHLYGLPSIRDVRVEVDWAQGREVFTRTDWRPPGDLIAPVGPQPANAALRDGELALVHVTPLSTLETSEVQRLTVLLDTSASSADILETYARRLRELTEDLAAQQGAPVPIQLAVFDQEAIPLLQTRSDRLGQELHTLLVERGALGATDLQRALTSVAELPELGDRVWLFTDGVVTAGPDEAIALQAAVRSLEHHGVRRLDVVSPAGVLDRPRLEALVTAGLPEAGVVVTNDARDTALRRLTARTLAQVDLHVPNAAWAYPARLTGVEPGRRYPVFVQLPERASLSLRLGGREVAVREAPTRAGALLRREWARRKIEYLQRKLESADGGGDADRVRARIVELSREQRVLSDHTALVVLETEADYRRHGIDRTALADVLVVDNGQLAGARRQQTVQDTLFHEPFLRERETGEGQAEPSEDGDGARPAPILGASPEAAARAQQVREPQLQDRSAGTIASVGVDGQLPRTAHGVSAAPPNDPMSSLGALMGDQIGGDFGFGGLALRGSGHSGDGNIGLDIVGGTGYGRGAGGFRGRSRKIPRVRFGKVDVRGGAVEGERAAYLPAPRQRGALLLRAEARGAWGAGGPGRGEVCHRSAREGASRGDRRFYVERRMGRALHRQEDPRLDLPGARRWGHCGGAVPVHAAEPRQPRCHRTRRRGAQPPPEGSPRAAAAGAATGLGGASATGARRPLAGTPARGGAAHRCR